MTSIHEERSLIEYPWRINDGLEQDIYTKTCTSEDKWQKACELVNVIDPKNLREVIIRRADILKALKYDQQWHPINKRPQVGNSATRRKWIEQQGRWLASSLH